MTKRQRTKAEAMREIEVAFPRLSLDQRSEANGLAVREANRERQANRAAGRRLDVAKVKTAAAATDYLTAYERHLAAIFDRDGGGLHRDIPLSTLKRPQRPLADDPPKERGRPLCTICRAEITRADRVCDARNGQPHVCWDCGSPMYKSLSGVRMRCTRCEPLPNLSPTDRRYPLLMSVLAARQAKE